MESNLLGNKMRVNNLGDLISRLSEDGAKTCGKAMELISSEEYRDRIGCKDQYVIEELYTVLNHYKDTDSFQKVIDEIINL